MPIIAAALRHYSLQEQQQVLPTAEKAPFQATTLSQLSTALLALPLAPTSLPLQHSQQDAQQLAPTGPSVQEVALQLALAALPVPTPASFASQQQQQQQQRFHCAPSPAATAEEVQALRKLLHYQHLHHNTDQLQPLQQQQQDSDKEARQSDPSSTASASSRSAAQLPLVVAVYCHHQLTTSEWRTVLGSCKGALELAGREGMRFEHLDLGHCCYLLIQSLRTHAGFLPKPPYYSAMLPHMTLS